MKTPIEHLKFCVKQVKPIMNLHEKVWWLEEAKEALEYALKEAKAEEQLYMDKVKDIHEKLSN